MKKNEYKGIVVAVGGPPHSGKSVFLAELYRQILQRKPDRFCFLQRACPDGEGMWSDESDPAIVREIRRKARFSKEFMLFTLKSIENLGKFFPLVLLDLGGKRTAENAEILARSSHIIIVSSSSEETQKWIEFAENEKCEVLAILRSELTNAVKNAVKSEIDFSAPPVKGIIYNLQREGSKEPYRKAVSQFADWLIEQV